ncbi:MAG: hypothetical protein CMG49_00330 [Candidatus Marinimicrobia bacterium]|nr:hypothetical protein [Candidatus Neomarinimicrobiota bacterium]
MLEASTFKDKEIINLAKNNFISLKINAETEYGIPLFNRFNGTGYPLILFLDSNGNELDRISGFLPDYEFIIKMQNILNGKNTFTYYLDEYNKNNHSSEILFALANKYKEKNEVDKAISLYKQLLNSSNVSKSDYDNSKYSLAILSIQKNNTALILEYLNENPYSDNVEIAVFELINYYKSQQMNFEEIELYNKYLKKLDTSYNFLNSFAWRMSELNIDLEVALLKINEALELIEKKNEQYPNLLDTKAEVLWKSGKVDEAIKCIQQAIDLKPENKYYISQKEKFINS